jgi:hypothetical protein
VGLFVFGIALALSCSNPPTPFSVLIYQYRVLAQYMGFVVDLSVMWAPYKAASLALGNSVAPDNMKSMLTTMLRAVDTNITALRQLLTEGVLTEEFVMDHTPRTCLSVCRLMSRSLSLSLLLSL